MNIKNDHWGTPIPGRCGRQPDEGIVRWVVPDRGGVDQMGAGTRWGQRMGPDKSWVQMGSGVSCGAEGWGQMGAEPDEAEGSGDPIWYPSHFLVPHSYLVPHPSYLVPHFSICYPVPDNGTSTLTSH